MDSSLLRNDRSEAMDRSPVDMAWLVLEAANDRGSIHRFASVIAQQGRVHDHVSRLLQGRVN